MVAHIDTLTKDQASFILNRSGLGAIFNKIKDISDSNVNFKINCFLKFEN